MGVAMSLDNIKYDFDRLYDRAKIFESLLPAKLQKPDIDIHSGNFYGEEKLQYIKFTWKKGYIRFSVTIFWNYYEGLYTNTDTHTVDKRQFGGSMEKLIALISVYLELFREV